LPAICDSLERLYRTFDHLESASDPIHIVRRYRAPEDREIVGFCAAGLAFGRVASVLNSIESLLAVMGPHPAAFVRDFDPAKGRVRLAPLVHRWIRGNDLAALLLILQRMLCEYGSIERFFLKGDDPASPDVGAALDAFSTRALETDVRPAYGRVPKRPGVRYFFPRPSAGSACKRLNLFLRWMVRKDVVDLGRLDGPVALTPHRAARHARHSAGAVSAIDTLPEPRLEDGGRDHRVAARDRPGRSRTLRLLALPRRDDERLRLQPRAERLAVSAARRVPARRA
jgi:uncharacterized protein (TIGR02757 family)